MKSLDERLSTVVSPFEDNEKDQSEVNEEQYYQYRRDSLLNAISKRTGYRTFDLFFEELLEEMNSSDTEEFITDCIDELTSIYSLDVLKDWIIRNSLIEDNQKEIISLIRYFVYNEHLKDLVFHLPIISIAYLDSKDKITNLIKDSYTETQDKIIMDSNLHPLIRHYFKYCPMTSGINTLLVLIYKDLPGLVSGQLVITQGETE